jgi:hypothetical protein
MMGMKMPPKGNEKGHHAYGKRKKKSPWGELKTPGY